MRRQFLVPKLWSKLPHSRLCRRTGRWYIEDCRRVTHCDYLDDSEPILKVEGNSGSDGSKAFCPCNLTFLESVDLLERSFNLSLMTAAVRRPQRKRRRAAAPIFTTRQLLNSAKCQLQNSCRVRGESCTCTWFVHDLNMICTWFVYSMKYSNSQITVHKAPAPGWEWLPRALWCWNGQPWLWSRWPWPKGWEVQGLDFHHLLAWCIIFHHFSYHFPYDFSISFHQFSINFPSSPGYPTCWGPGRVCTGRPMGRFSEARGWRRSRESYPTDTHVIVGIVVI